LLSLFVIAVVRYWCCCWLLVHDDETVCLLAWVASDRLKEAAVFVVYYSMIWKRSFESECAVDRHHPRTNTAADCNAAAAADDARDLPVLALLMRTGVNQSVLDCCYQKNDRFDSAGP